jgi:hypothetical protein
MATTKQKDGIRVPRERAAQILEDALLLAEKRGPSTKFSENAPTGLLDAYTEAFLAGASFALEQLEDRAER